VTVSGLCFFALLGGLIVLWSDSTVILHNILERCFRLSHNAYLSQIKRHERCGDDNHHSSRSAAITIKIVSI
jgi:hypothetical protein